MRIKPFMLMLTIFAVMMSVFALGASQRTAAPVGELILHGGTTAPAGTLFLDGATYNKVEHQALANSSSAFIESTTATTFTLIDARGAALYCTTALEVAGTEVDGPDGGDTVSITVGNDDGESDEPVGHALAKEAGGNPLFSDPTGAAYAVDAIPGGPRGIRVMYCVTTGK